MLFSVLPDDVVGGSSDGGGGGVVVVVTIYIARKRGLYCCIFECVPCSCFDLLIHLSYFFVIKECSRSF